MTAPAPARVTIYRTHDHDVRQRQVLVYLDDRPKVTLMFGESFTREIDPGRHEVRFNNTLIKKTLAFDAAPGEHVEIDVVNHRQELFPFYGGLGYRVIGERPFEDERLNQPSHYVIMRKTLHSA